MNPICINRQVKSQALSSIGCNNFYRHFAARRRRVSRLDQCAFEIHSVSSVNAFTIDRFYEFSVTRIYSRFWSCKSPFSSANFYESNGQSLPDSKLFGKRMELSHFIFNKSHKNKPYRHFARYLFRTHKRILFDFSFVFHDDHCVALRIRHSRFMHFKLLVDVTVFISNLIKITNKNANWLQQLH